MNGLMTLAQRNGHRPKTITTITLVALGLASTVRAFAAGRDLSGEGGQKPGDTD